MNFDASIVQGNNYTVFAIVHRSSNLSDNYFVGTQSAVTNQGLHMGFNTDSSVRLGQVGNDLSGPISTQAESSVGLVWGRLNSSGKQVYYNGITFSDSESTQVTGSGAGVIGRGFDSNGFDGNIAELIIFSSDLSDYEIGLMQDYLRNKWLRPTLISDIRLWLDSSDQATVFTDAGCSIGQTWDTTGILLHKDVDPKWRYTMPKEGGLGWIDTMGIPSGAANVEQAYALINFLLRPEIGGMFANNTGYNSAAVGASEHMAPDAKAAFEMAYPEEAAIDGLWWWPAQTSFFGEIRAEYVEKLTNA